MNEESRQFPRANNKLKEIERVFNHITLESKWCEVSHPIHERPPAVK